MGGKVTTTKTGFVTFSFPEFNLKKQMCSSWAFHLDDRSESSSTYDMIIGNQSRSSWRIRHNHEYKPASLDNVIKTCENLHVEEQHQLKTLLPKYEHLLDGTLGEFNMEHRIN
jgi:hypothetical protein